MADLSWVEKIKALTDVVGVPISGTVSENIETIPSLEDGVYFDSASGSGAGTTWPLGSAQNPSDDEASVVDMCIARNVKKIYVSGTFEIGEPMQNYNFFGINETTVVDLGGQDIGTFEDNTGGCSGSPITLGVGITNVTITTDGTFDVIMPVGCSAVVTSDDWVVTGSPKACPAGATTTITVEAGGGPGTIIVTAAGKSVDGSWFENCELTGTQGGTSFIYGRTVVLNNVIRLCGILYDVTLRDAVTTSNPAFTPRSGGRVDINGAHVVFSDTPWCGGAMTVIDFTGVVANTGVSILGLKGMLMYGNMTNSNAILHVTGEDGAFVYGSRTDTAGYLYLSGDCYWFPNNAKPTSFMDYTLQTLIQNKLDWTLGKFTDPCTLANIGGTVNNSPVSFARGVNTPNILTSGTFTMHVPTGCTAVVTTGGWVVTGSPQTCNAGNNLVTVEAGGTGTITVTVTGTADWLNSNLSTLLEKMGDDTASVKDRFDAIDAVVSGGGGDAIYYDAINGEAGTTSPVGTAQRPSNNLLSVKTMCTARKLKKVIVQSNAAPADATGSIADDTGTLITSPTGFVQGYNIVQVATAGKFNITLPDGVIGVAETDGWVVTGSPVTLVPGVNSITVEAGGTGYISTTLWLDLGGLNFYGTSIVEFDLNGNDPSDAVFYGLTVTGGQNGTGYMDLYNCIVHEISNYAAYSYNCIYKAVPGGTINPRDGSSIFLISPSSINTDIAGAIIDMTGIADTLVTMYDASGQFFFENSTDDGNLILCSGAGGVLLATVGCTNGSFFCYGDCIMVRGGAGSFDYDLTLYAMTGVNWNLETAPSVSVDRGDKVFTSMVIQNIGGGPVEATEVTSVPLITISRYRQGYDTTWTAIVTTDVMVVTNALATYNYHFPAVSWENGDRVQVEVTQGKVERAGQQYLMFATYGYSVVETPNYLQPFMDTQLIDNFETYTDTTALDVAWKDTTGFSTITLDTTGGYGGTRAMEAVIAGGAGEVYKSLPHSIYGTIYPRGRGRLLYVLCKVDSTTPTVGITIREAANRATNYITWNTVLGSALSVVQIDMTKTADATGGSFNSTLCDEIAITGLTNGRTFYFKMLAEIIMEPVREYLSSKLITGYDSSAVVANEDGSVMERLQALMDEAEVIENHLHPDLSVTTPNGRLRVGALTFDAAAANTETITLSRAGGSSRVYTFKTALGATPAAGNVTILVQGTSDLTARKFANAINGVTDAVNILYASGESYHPNFTGGYTGLRVAIGTAIHPTTGTGPTVVVVGRNGDVTGAATLSDTLGSHAGIYKLTAITRIYSSRYILTGNAAALDDRITGAYQCVCPMNSVRNPKEVGSPICKYDVGKIVVEAAVSDTLITECDGYYSTDEATFVPMWYGLELSRDQATKGCQQFLVSSGRIPAGAGFYLKCRSNGTDPTDWVDFKAQYHVYPSAL